MIGRLGEDIVPIPQRHTFKAETLQVVGPGQERGLLNLM